MADEIINIPNNLREYLATFGNHTTLSDTTPPAPSGDVNVAWQTDEFGNISAYVPTEGVSVGSLNSLTGALTISAGSGVTVTPAGSTITISASGGGNISGSGALTVDVIPKASTATSITNSSITDDGTTVRSPERLELGVAPPSGTAVSMVYTPTAPLSDSNGTIGLYAKMKPNFGTDQSSAYVMALS